MAPSFEDVDLLARLSQFTDADLDDLDFGVIGFDADTQVTRFNTFESKIAEMLPQRVLGRLLFTVVAPCMNNFLVAQHFEDATAQGVELDVVLDYVLTLRMRPKKVTLRLLASPADPIRYVLVQRRD